ncbi:EAL domain-containing protein [Pararhizobium sp. IMCC21322]|uniref:EAL domain-containing protein n=1 Tax=Pararhizobium sp. IMCC21322 TaxID=3067903 RepID=UPI002741B76C|nr:EAL domain-containing protein [Pararhizobium sp. IMCC21322]
MKLPRFKLLLPSWLLTGLVPVALLLCAVLYQSAGLWQSADNWFVENRMRFSDRPAEQEIVFLAIDRKTLNDVGVWPWPRSIIAKAVDQLVEHEALEIFLDIDFSAPSIPKEDEILSEVLRKADGTVILAAFSQSESVTSDADDMADSLPLPMFQEYSWIATVNVMPEPDGIVRKFPYGHLIGGEPLPSVPAVLSGKTGPPDTYFDINFAIDPATVPTYSLIDLLNDELPRSAFAQKTVVVGAHAMELRDSLAVPIHGTLSGSMLQIIATETLRQDVDLVWILPIWPLLLAAVLQVVFLQTLHRRRMTLRVIALGAISICAETAGFVLFSQHALVLPTAAVHGMTAAMLVLLAIREMDIRRYMTLVADARATNAASLLRQVFDDSTEAIIILGENGDILEASPKSRQIFGRVDLETSSNHLPPEVLKKARIAIASLKSSLPIPVCEGELQTGTDDDYRVIEYSITPSQLRDTDNRALLKGDGRFVACVMARDISDKRKQAEALSFLSKRDELTGAYRRHAFADVLDQKLSQLSDDQSCQILVLNLNRFKTINATLGRDVGNQLLCAIVARLEASDLDFECVARLLGDTFAILLKSTDQKYLLKAKGEETARLLEGTYSLDGVSVSIDARISYVWSEDSIQSAEAMLHCAELALDECRNSGTRAIKGFDPVSTAKHRRAREIERDLRPALERENFEVHYQPQVDVNGRHLVGVEALARWTHPVLGAISPLEFITIAEASGTIVPLGKWILKTACHEAASWSSPIKLSVNVSPVQLARGDIIEDVQAALEESGLPPGRLQLEITESSFLEGDGEIMNTLRDIQSLGVSLALDDFGTGYASLGFISRFSIDMIKVDQSFIRTLTTDLASQSIVQFTKTLSDVLDLTMLCEGVETEQQMNFLRLVGCDQAQGFLFGRAQPANAIREMIGGLGSDEVSLRLASNSGT